MLKIIFVVSICGDVNLDEFARFAISQRWEGGLGGGGLDPGLFEMRG